MILLKIVGLFGLAILILIRLPMRIPIRPGKIIDCSIKGFKFN